MTHAQAMRKIRSLLKSMRRDIVEECERLLKSGAVDLDDFDDNYVLPRMTLYVALGNERKHWLMPHMGPVQKRTVRNLEKF